MKLIKHTTESTGIIYHRVTPPNATTSYHDGDAKWRLDQGDFDKPVQQGRLVELEDFFTLKENNVFGTPDRFTDSSGGQTYADNLLVCHCYNKMWDLTNYTAKNWSEFADDFQAIIFNNGGFTDWKWSTWREYATLAFEEDGKCLNYEPFLSKLPHLNNGTSKANNMLYTCETTKGAAGYKYVFWASGGSIAPYFDVLINRNIATEDGRMIPVRDIQPGDLTI